MIIQEFKIEFVRYIVKPLKEGVIYISEEYGVTVHLCACGCRQETVMPFNHIINGQDHGWKMIKEGDLITFSPSVGNFIPPPYHAHYFIRRNVVEWAEPINHSILQARQ